MQKDYFSKREIKIKPEWITVDDGGAVITKVMNTPKGSLVRCYTDFNKCVSITNQKGVWYEPQNEVWTNQRPKGIEK
jgi:hypothetical protein